MSRREYVASFMTSRCNSKYTPSPIFGKSVLSSSFGFASILDGYSRISLAPSTRTVMRRLLLSFATLGLLAACGGGDSTTPAVTPAITLTASASSGTIARGATSTTTLTITRSSSFTGDVALAAEGLPAGVTVAFAPTSIANGSTTSIATISVDQTAAIATSSFTIRASGTGVSSQTVAYSVTVPAPATPTITISAGGGAASAVQGSAATVPITVTRANGATAITLTSTGAPTGVTVAFAPATLTTETASTLTLTVASTTVVGTYPIVVSAAATGATTQNVTVQLTVTAAAAAGFSLTSAPAALSVTAGQGGTSVVTLARTGGFAGDVAMTATGAPAGMTVTFAPATLTGAAATSTATIATTAATVAGTYTLTIRGNSTGQTERTTSIAVTVGAAPGVTVALAPTTLSIAQNSSAQSVVTIARIGSLTGDVAMTATGMPTGLTVAFAPATVTGTSTTALVTVGSVVAVGTYPIVITGTGVGSVLGTATLSVTVTAAQGFTLAASAAAAVQGATGASTITITRIGGFTTNVDLTATGLPANVTAAFNPASASGTTSTLTFTAAAGATPGSYTVTVNGTAAGATTQSTTVALTITASGGGGGGNIAWKFCDATRVPLWFAFRNGTSGTWTRVTPSADNTFSFSLSGSSGGVALVQGVTNGGTQGTVYYYTTTELTGIAASECTTSPGGKSITGTYAGLTNSATAIQSGISFLGSASGTASGANVTFNNVPNKTTDLLAYRNVINLTAGTFSADRGVLRRNVNVPGISTVGTIDFDGAESFALATGTITFTNAGTDQTAVIASFTTTNGTAGSIVSVGGAGTVLGIPASKTQAGDLHLQIASASTADGLSSRVFAQYNKDIANRAFTLGAVLAAPTLSTTATSPYARVKVATAFTSDYGDAAGSTMAQGAAATARSWTFNQSRGYLGTGVSSFEFELLDFSGVSGFLNSWGFVTGTQVQVSTNIIGGLVGSLSGPTEGSSFKSASRTQTIVP